MLTVAIVVSLSVRLRGKECIGGRQRSETNDLTFMTFDVGLDMSINEDISRMSVGAYPGCHR